MQRVLSAQRTAFLLGDYPSSPAYAGIADGLRTLIADGRVPLGVRLPSERDLTDALGVSRTTVTRAYRVLADQGYLVTRRGSGAVASVPAGRGDPGDHVLAPRADAGHDVVDLTCAASPPVPGTFEAYERAVAELPAHLGGTGYYPTGLPALRESVAARYCARGLPTSPGQVIITSGALSALAVAVRATTATGDRALTESPTYPNAIATLKRAGLRVAGVDVGTGAEPYDVDAVGAAARQTSAQVAYLVPDFHNPTGRLLDDADRERLAGHLRRSRTTPLVDEALVDLVLDPGASPAPFATFSPSTLSVGSASKSFWGGLRIGWLRAPDEQVAAVLSARLSLDLGAPVVEQLTFLHLLDRADDLLRWRSAELRSARDAFLGALHRAVPTWRISPPPGGLALWAELPQPLSSALTRSAEEHGVLLAAGPSFAPEGGLERFVRLPFSASPDALLRAADRLAPAWQQALEGRPGAAGRRPVVA